MGPAGLGFPMADEDVFADLRERQRSAVIVNQRAQLDVYARALAGLKQQNRELKRELKRTRRQSRSAKHAARVLLRRASFRKVTPPSQPTHKSVPTKSGTNEPEIDVEIASPRPKLVEFTVDRAAIESRFDSSYYAREHDLPDTAQAWDQYLVHGIPQGASINFAHHQALGSWSPESNRWLLALKVLRLRQPDSHLLAAQSERELYSQFQSVVDFLPTNDRGLRSQELRALSAIAARYCPDVDPLAEADAAALLSDTSLLTELERSVATDEAQASDQVDAASAGRRWGAVFAALSRANGGSAPASFEYLATGITPTATTEDLGDTSVGSGPDPREVVRCLFGVAGSPDLVAFQQSATHAGVALLEEIERVGQTPDVIFGLAEGQLMRHLVDPDPVVAELWFGSRAGDDEARGRGVRPDSAWLEEDAGTHIRSEIARSGWPAAYVVWRPVRALSKEAVSRA